MISALYDSPVGTLTLSSDGVALTQLEFDNPKHPLPRHPPGKNKVLDLAMRELDAYFAGTLRAFSVKTAPQGTDFQQKVWAALLTIPYGDTRTYGQQAKVIGQPKASRAVGLANGRNPVAIIIPCHRVIGSNGSLTGFGGGIERKQILLELEQGGNLLARAS
jgi:methylated-DNA-[protein]-cysteine S-methyltransferase